MVLAEQMRLHITWIVTECGEISRLHGMGGLGVFFEWRALELDCHVKFECTVCPECTVTMSLAIWLLTVFGSGLLLCVGGRFSWKIFDYAEEILRCAAAVIPLALVKQLYSIYVVHHIKDDTYL